VAVRVDTKRLTQEVEALEMEKMEALAQLREAKKVAAGPAREESIHGGGEGLGGLLGVMMVAAFLDAERSEQAKVTKPFVDNLNSINDLRRETKKILDKLREQAVWIEDSVYRVLSQRGVTVLERRRIEEVLEERRLASAAEFRPRDFSDLLTATHLVVFELGKPQSSGSTCHLTASLIDCGTGQTLWSDNRDRMNIPVSSGLATTGRFLMGTGQLAVLSPPDGRQIFKLVHLEHASGDRVRYRELLQMDTKEVDASKVKVTSVAKDGDVPSPMVPQYFAWKIAEATMPLALTVSPTSGATSKVPLGQSSRLRAGDLLHVYRRGGNDGTSATWERFPVAAMVKTIGAQQAEINLGTGAVSHLWQEEGMLDDRDLVVPAGRAVPLVASLGVDVADTTRDQTVMLALGIKNPVQLDRALTELRGTLNGMSLELQQVLRSADLPLIDVNGNNEFHQRENAKRQGATHLVRWHAALTGTRLRYDIRMEVFPIDKEGEKTLVQSTLRGGVQR